MKLLKPTKGRVLVDPIKPNEVQKSGLVVPNTFQDASSEGIVVEIGTGKESDVKIGDRVFFNRFNGIQVDIRGHAYKILEHSELLAIIE